MKGTLGAFAVALSTQLFASFVLSLPTIADDRDKLAGNWRLVSFYTEDVQTKQRNNVYGEQPKGYVAFTGGRFIGIATAEGRKQPQTSEDQAAAFRSMIAYTGKYRVEGDKYITKVDVAWNEGWVGTEQIRFWRLEGDRLNLTTAPMPNPNVSGGMLIGTLVWERE